MKDVAERAGVSTATVSRVFSLPDVVSEAIRSRVLDAAQDLNYAMNGMARGLSRNESHVILIGVPDIGNLFFAKLLKGLEQRARELGYSVLISDMSDEEGLLAAYSREIAAGRADGIVLINGSASKFRMDRIRNGARRQIANPLLILMQRNLEGPIATLGIDNEAAAVKAMQHLLDLGHRRIAHITGAEDNVRSRERLIGYRRALASAGIPFDERLLHFGDYDTEYDSGVEGVRRFFEAGAPFTAIFCSGDGMAMGAMAELKKHDLTVPADVSIIGFGGLEFAVYADPPLTTVSQPRAELGEAAMSLLVDALQGKEPDTTEVVMDAELIVRGTTAPVRLSPSS
jgi:LacI family repressor for deo operon, udp, cdd, tsx, nupC, and nupG